MPFWSRRRNQAENDSPQTAKSSGSDTDDDDDLSKDVVPPPDMSDYSGSSSSSSYSGSSYSGSSYSGSSSSGSSSSGNSSSTDSRVDSEFREKVGEAMDDDLELMREIVFKIREDEDFAKNIYKDCPRLQALLEEHPDLRPVFEDQNLVRINFEKVYRDAGGVLPEDEPEKPNCIVRGWRKFMYYVGIITNTRIFKIFRCFLILKRLLGLLSPTKGISCLKGFLLATFFEDLDSPPELPDGVDVDTEATKIQLNNVAEHMEDPEVQEKMQEIMQDPEGMDEAIENDPELKALRDSNPLVAEMMTDPETMKILVDPDNLRALGECPDFIEADFADPNFQASGLDTVQEVPEVDIDPDLEPEPEAEMEEAELEQDDDELDNDEELEEEEEEEEGIDSLQKTKDPKAAKKAQEAGQDVDANGDGVETAGMVASLGMGAMGMLGLDLDMGFGFGGSGAEELAGAGGEELGAEGAGGLEGTGLEETGVEGEQPGLEVEEQEEGGLNENLQDEFDDMESDVKAKSSTKGKAARSQDIDAEDGGNNKAVKAGLLGAVGGAVIGTALGAVIGDAADYVEDAHDAYADQESSDEDDDKKKAGKDGEEGEEGEEGEGKKKKGVFRKGGKAFKTFVTDTVKSSVLAELIGDDAAEALEDDIEDYQDDYGEDSDEEGKEGEKEGDGDRNQKDSKASGEGEEAQEEKKKSRRMFSGRK